jgi:hypothetical protein
MKKILLSITGLLMIMVVSVKSQAQQSVTAHATAEIIVALTATESATMNFGKFSPEGSGGEIRLTPNGVRTATGTVALSGGTYNPAIFNLSGQNNSSVTITLPTAPAYLTNSENGKTMEVGGWESYPAAGLGAGVLIDGVLNLNVGATLKVGTRSDNPVGIYSGTYSITFSYN